MTHSGILETLALCILSSYWAVSGGRVNPGPLYLGRQQKSANSFL